MGEYGYPLTDWIHILPSFSESSYALNDLFKTQRDFLDISTGATTPWYELLLSSFVVALGDAEVTYFTAGITGEEEEKTVEVVAYTKDAVLFVSQPIGEGNTSIETVPVHVVARNSLTRYSVQSEQGIFDVTNRRESFPRGVTISLEYVEDVLTIPHVPAVHAKQNEATVRLLAELIEDVK